MLKYCIGIFLLTIIYSQAIIAAQPIFVDKAEDAFMLSKDIKTDLLVVFGADWCGACNIMKHDISTTDIVGDIIVCFIDIDKRPDLKKEYRVKIVPDYMIYRDGVEIKRKTSYKSKNDLIQFLHNDDR